MKTGDIFETKRYGPVEVIEYQSSRSVIVRFLNTGFEKAFEAYSVKTGSVRDPMFPVMFGRGYIGVGDYCSVSNGKADKAYETWQTMFWRCYSEKYKARRPTYEDCEVHEDWYNFQNFAEWYYKHKLYPDHQLDKDILIKGNKIYSEETCRFVPLRVNSLLICCKRARKELPLGVTKDYNKYVATMQNGEGAQISLGRFETVEEAFLSYKTNKEALIKRVAEEYKDRITEDVYLSLLNWNVDIND